jgi:hypothetical protein
MTDAKARLLQMIADEPHMGGGGLLKAVSKAQKVAKKAETGARAILPAAERDANLAKMLEGSAVKSRMYHGTGRDIKEFDKSKLRRTAFGEGFHLAESPNLASFYANQFDEGQNVMPVHAAIKNPYELQNMHDWYDVPGANDKDKTNFLKSQGYDGIKYPHGANGDQTSPPPSVYVAFEPEQIKSAIGNRGTYDLTDPDITKAGGGLLKAVGKAQKVAKKAKMYSAVDKALEASKRGAGTGMEFANELSKTSGIKKAELVDRGIMVPSKNGPVLNPALTQLPKMTKQDFVSHLNEKYKPPGVRKITLGSVKFDDLSDQDLYKEYVRIRGSEPEAYGEPMSREDILYELSGAPDKDTTRAKYGEYKLPGAENYRENLYQYENPAGKAFLQKHFDEPNVLYHMRQTDRIEPTYTSAQIDAIGQRMAEAMGTKVENLGSGAPILMMRQGVISPVEAAQFSHAKGFRNMDMDVDMSPAQRRALHIEEIQSDWHQKGRKGGYENELAYQEARQKADEVARAAGYQDAFHAAEGWKSHGMESAKEASDMLDEASKFKSVNSVPDAPFKNNWHELALKQALMDAAEGDYDQLLITPGAEQAKRFDLTKVANAISYHPDDKGRGMFLNVFGKNNQVIYSKLTPESELPNVIGQETTQKLLAQAPDDGNRVLSGLDLELGGEGMKGFYDKMVPSYLNDLGKKYGVRVGERTIEGEVPHSVTIPSIADANRIGGEMFGITDFNSLSKEQFDMVKKAFEEQARAEYTTKLHSFDITPEMREDILNNGLPMYQRGGAVHMAGGGRTPKYPWERYPQPKKVTEMRAREINPVAGAVKKGADYATQLIDKGPSFSSLVGNLVGAVPFVGPDLRKRMEESEISIPTDFTMPSFSPEYMSEQGTPVYKQAGVEMGKIPAKDLMEAFKMSDFTPFAGLSNVAESIGYGQMPDPLDLLDAAGVGALGYGAVKAGAKGVKAAKQGALSAAKAAERFAEKKVPEVMERGGMGAQMLGAFGQNTQSNVVKEPGGNWLSGTVEQSLKPLRKRTVGLNDPAEYLATLEQKHGKAGVEEILASGMFPMIKENIALNNWVDRNLGNYVKKQMATPDDPVRKLAEEGIVHIPSEQVGVNRYRAPKHRETYDGQQLGESEAAKAWEDASDVAINAPRAKAIKENESLYQENPWVEKLSNEERVFTLDNPAPHRVGMAANLQPIHGLGFDHIVDVLNQDLAAGRIRPEQLNKISMEQAVRRTYEFDQEMAKKARETAIKQTEGMPVYKQYPEGYKWIELNLTPEQKALAKEYDQKFKTELGNRVAAYSSDKSKKIPVEAIKEQLQKEMGPNPMQGLEDALKYEGNTMGHCVGGYCPDVVEGRSRIFSLRDAKGEPHVTIEVKPPSDYSRAIQATKLRAQGLSPEKAELEVRDISPEIVQIKGKQNRAPKEDYLPFVQDFVKGGAWEEVGDIKNTGLKSLNEAFPRKSDRENFEKLYPNQKYVTADEINIHKTKVDKELIDQYKDWKSKVDLEDPNFKDYEGPEFISNSEYFKRYHPDNTERQANFIRGGVDSPYMIPPEHLGMKDWDTLMREGVFSYDDVSFLTKVMPQRYLTAEDIAKAKTRLEDSPLSPPEPGMAQGGAVSDAKQRLLDMIAEEPHMAGGGFIGAIGKAQKAAKAAEAAKKAAQSAKYLPGVHYADPLAPPTMKMSEALGNVGAEGKTLNFTETDRSRVFGPNRGGAGFAGLQHYSLPHKEANTVWGFGNKTTAEKKIRQNDPENTIWTTYAGSPTQHKSNTVVVKDALKQLQEANLSGAVHPTQIEFINSRIRSAVNDKKKPLFPSDFDITDPKAFDFATTFDRRAAISDALMGIGVKKPMISKEFKSANPGVKWQDAANIEAILKRETDPAMMGANTFDVGPNLFVMDNGILQRPDLNEAFPFQVTGTDLGMRYELAPFRDAAPDWMQARGIKPDEPINPWAMSRAAPSQFVSEKYLTGLQKKGRKAGGLAQIKKVKRHGNTVPH